MKVRLKPGGRLVLGALGVTMRPGDEADLPRDTVERHAGRLEVLEDNPAPTEGGLDVSAYHVGGGWYEIPGEPHKVRKAEAESILQG